MEVVSFAARQWLLRLTNEWPFLTRIATSWCAFTAVIQSTSGRRGAVVLESSLPWGQRRYRSGAGSIVTEQHVQRVSPLLVVQRYAGEQINWLSCAGSLRSALPIKLRYPHCFTRLIAQLIANEESWIATQVNGDAVNVRVANWSLKPITQRMNELLWALVNRHSGKLSDDKGGQAFDIEHTGFRYQRTAVINMNKKCTGFCK